MLVVHPNSVCDVCLDCFNTEDRAPGVIPCGHVFCQSCLESLNRFACPLCRDRFQPDEVRRIHIDPSSPGPVGPEAARAKMPPEVRRFLDTVQEFMRDGAPQPQFRQLAAEMLEWSKRQPQHKFEELRVVMRLLMSVDWWFNKAHKLEGSVRKANQLIEESNGRIEAAEKELQEMMRSFQEERAVAEQRYQELLAQSQEEREAAQALEISLKEQIDDLVSENKLLMQQARRAGFDMQHLLQPVLARDVQASDALGKGISQKPKDTKGPKNFSEVAPTPMTNMIPFLSPLPIAISISSPVSSFITFAPLPEDDPAESKPSQQLHAAMETPSVRAAPVFPRQRSPLPPSGLSRTRPVDFDRVVDQDPSRSMINHSRAENLNDSPPLSSSRHSPTAPHQRRPSDPGVDVVSHQRRPPEHGVDMGAHQRPDHGVDAVPNQRRLPEHGVDMGSHQRRLVEHGMDTGSHQRRLPEHGMDMGSHQRRLPEHGMDMGSHQRRPPDHGMDAVPRQRGSSDHGADLDLHQRRERTDRSLASGASRPFELGVDAVPHQRRPSELGVDVRRFQEQNQLFQSNPPEDNASSHYIDEAEAERSRVLQLQEILTSPTPTSVRLGRAAPEIETHRKGGPPQQMPARAVDAPSGDVPPRMQYEPSSSNQPLAERYDPHLTESRHRTHSDTSLNRQDTSVAYPKPSSSYSVSSISSGHRSEMSVLRRSNTESRIRSIGEAPPAQPHVSPSQTIHPLSKPAAHQPAAVPIASQLSLPPTTSSTPSNASQVHSSLAHRESGRTALSTASLAAQALEKERRKAEKEREKDKTRDRGETDRAYREQREREMQQKDWSKGRNLTSSVSLSGSSTYGSPAPSLYGSSTFSVNNGKGKMNVPPLGYA